MPLILPPNEIVKPATLSRRGFLRAMGVTATIVVPSLVVPKQRYAIGGKPRLIRTLKTVQSGRWSDPATWGGTLPTPEDKLIVAHKVRVDRNITIGIAKCLT